MSDIEVMLIIRAVGEEQLRDKEGQWAYRLRTVSQNRRSRVRK